MNVCLNMGHAAVSKDNLQTDVPSIPNERFAFSPQLQVRLHATLCMLFSWTINFLSVTLPRSIAKPRAVVYNFTV